MGKAKLEMVVGVFVFVGILCLAYLSIKLGKLEMMWSACSYSSAYCALRIFRSSSGNSR